MQLLLLREQKKSQQLLELSDRNNCVMGNARLFKAFPYKIDPPCFQVRLIKDNYLIDTAYFVGVDWLVENEIAVYVEPKKNEFDIQIDYLSMLLESLEVTDNFEYLEGLFHVEYDLPWIEIKQKQDILSPFLIVQFLKIIQKIVRKGLKKSYYRVTENLNSRIKGKILIGKQIKENIIKNRFTRTICNFQEFGINTTQNQFLKLVLKFISSYINKTNQYFTTPQKEQLQHILNYCQPAFEYVDVLKSKHQQILVHGNVFYREYEEALRIGNYILRRFSFNISKVGEENIITPPFWIDMSKLFELYVFGKLKETFNPETVTYHDEHNRKETDILIREVEHKCVIDCKYKPQYAKSSIELEDLRQLAGYTRLKSVYHDLGMQNELSKLVRGVIIYSDQNSSNKIKAEDLFKTPINSYIEFYKMGIKLPEIFPQ